MKICSSLLNTCFPSTSPTQLEDISEQIIEASLSKENLHDSLKSSTKKEHNHSHCQTQHTQHPQQPKPRNSTIHNPIYSPIKPILKCPTTNFDKKPFPHKVSICNSNAEFKQPPPIKAKHGSQLGLLHVEPVNQPLKNISSKSMKIIQKEFFEPFERKNKKYKSIALIKKHNASNLDNPIVTENDENIYDCPTKRKKGGWCVVQSRIILDCDIKRASKLMIEDSTGKALGGKVLSVNAAGLVNGLRNQRDGVCFFGIVQDEQQEKDENIINDFLLNIHLSNVNSFKEQKRLLAINFDLATQNYYIRPVNELKDSYGKDNRQLIFIRIETKVVISEKKFFFIGKSLMSFEPDHKRQHIQVKLYSKSKDLPQLYTFPKDKQLFIGSNIQQCDICINDPMLSPMHSYIKYEEDSWVIEDGNGYERSKSGTWMVLDEKYALGDVTYCKIGKCVIKITMYI